MTDTPPPLKPASPVRKTAVRAAQAGVNVIWLVPIIALIVTLAVAWNAYAERGALIEVEFADATGIVPGSTALRFREITVGQVEGVKFTDDLSHVAVQIRVDKDIAPYIDADATFWIVRPQVTAQGVSRLDTVLTGSFIEGYWDAEISEPRREFVGVDRAPLVREDAKGTWVKLSYESGEGLSEGAPIYYRGVQVGRMENLRLAEDGNSVLVDGFIQAPHDQRLTSATVFWDVSGFSVSLGAEGIALNVNSLTSLLQGGVSFDTPVTGGKPVDTVEAFPVQPDEETARRNVFIADETDQLKLTMMIDESLGGLAKGADVRLQGVNIGKVADLSVQPVEDGGGVARLREQVTLAISPVRLGLDPETTSEDAMEFLSRAVADGLRARVASSGLFGTELIVELVETDEAAAVIDMEARPFPAIPTAPSEISDFTQTAQGVLAKVGDLPIAEVMDSAREMLDSVTELARSEDTRAIPGSLRKTIEEAQGAASDLRSMVGEFRDSDAATRAGEAMTSASELAAKLNDAADRLPALIDSMQVTAGSVETIDFTSIGAELDATLQELRDVIGTQAAANLPGQISELIEKLEVAVTDIGAVAGEIRESGAGGNLGKMITEATSAFESVQAAAVDVPEMVNQIDAAAASVDEVNFAAISTQAEGILADLRAMLGSEDAERLPRNLSDTLEAASGLLNDLRDGNAAGSLNNALESASVAADEVAKSVEELPALIRRLQATAARADAVMAAYGDRSAFNTETINMLRELRRATESFGSLARMIERNPRAFILGR
ncbi:MlaD family protein [Paracoccus seriniphilus]|uniref:Paraquat-inducible protein B n=1 Tax=Paracoccus seriniphilus TaxID=184748 RepID=A0A239PY73_9RHOB|nr:MlaD family protein [Paracoccus seriniphilus]WCR14072.1 MCE family protein [Paracoccus seriniphilus]SNT74973.1 paraquat-inducible protein B [Paracoccus seriniphilus]